MTIGSRVSAVFLAFVVALIGWAGLRPFDFARANGVRWIEPGPGLQFEGAALAISVGELRWDTSSMPAPMSLEVWLRADPVADAEPRAWLALVDDSQLTPLGIRQEGADLVIWDAVTNPDGDRWYNDFRVPDAIRPDVLQHFALTSDGERPRLYVDGLPVEPSTGYGIPFARQGEPFGGTLVIGAGPPWDVPWSGEILGLALHDCALAEDVVQRHARLVPGQDLVALADVPGIMALYAFDELGGVRVHDRAGRDDALIVPRYFRPPRQRVLAPVDARDWATDWNALDILVNLGGFVPLGFLLAVLLHKRLPRIWLLGLVVLIGFVMSLAIELTQVLMVSRNSSVQDLMLNMLGTLGGAAAQMYASRRSERS